MTARKVLIVGNLRHGAHSTVERAVRRVGIPYLVVEDPAVALGLIHEHRWLALLVDLTSRGVENFCQQVSGLRPLLHVPLIAIVPRLGELAFTTAFRWGMDDVVRFSKPSALVRRFQNAPKSHVSVSTTSKGEAVIAGLNRSRCHVLGRVLAGAGFNVRYAADPESAQRYARNPSVELYVLHTELCSPRTVLAARGAKPGNGPIVIVTPQSGVAATRHSVSEHSDVEVMSSREPPENVLLLLKHMATDPGVERTEVRATAYGAMVAFGVAKNRMSSVGFTFTVSPASMYVRTLAPPQSGTVWVELYPPNSSQRVRLRTVVTWSRKIDDQGAEVAPPGFGAKIVASEGGDLQAWRAAFDPQPPRTIVTEVSASTPLTELTKTESAGETVIDQESHHPASLESSGRRVQQPQGEQPRTPNSNPSPALPGAGARPLGRLDLRQPQADSEQGTHSANTTQSLTSPRGKTTAGRQRDKPMQALGREDSSPPQVAPSSRRQRTSQRVSTIRLAQASSARAASVAPASTAQSVAASEAAPSKPALKTPTGAARASDAQASVRSRSRPTPLGYSKSDTRQRIKRATAEAAKGPAAERLALPDRPPTKDSGLLKITLGLACLGLTAALLTTLGQVTSSGEPSIKASTVATHSLTPAIPPQSTTDVAPIGSVASTRAAPSTKAASTPPLQPSGKATVLERTANANTEPSVAAITTAPPPNGKATPPTTAPSNWLASDRARLWIASGIESTVFVHGIAVGATNEWLETHCGIRFVRLGDAPGHWHSEGRPTVIKCRRNNVVEIEGQR